MIDCKCISHVKYEASGDNMKAILHKIDWCPKHGAVDDLIAALEEAKRQIQYLHEKFSVTGSGAQVLAKIETALKKARG